MTNEIFQNKLKKFNKQDINDVYKKLNFFNKMESFINFYSEAESLKYVVFHAYNIDDRNYLVEDLITLFGIDMNINGLIYDICDRDDEIMYKYRDDIMYKRKIYDEFMDVLKSVDCIQNSIITNSIIRILMDLATFNKQFFINSEKIMYNFNKKNRESMKQFLKHQISIVLDVNTSSIRNLFEIKDKYIKENI